jgi:hypothetical protein
LVLLDVAGVTMDKEPHLAMKGTAVTFVSSQSMLFPLLSLLLVSGSAFLSHGASSCCRYGTNNFHRPQTTDDGLKIISHASSSLQAKKAKANGADDFEFKKEEIQKMEDMIVSLSQEPTDDSRRSRLLSIFTEKLAKSDDDDGAPQHFIELFDYTLVIVGDRVKAIAQQEAAAAAVQKEQQLPTEQSSSDFLQQQKVDEAAPDEGSASTKQQQPAQLWALVDMMVQSKTIVKRAMGELGSRGTFQ